jgi:LmbE family N-acetylglucosaminyl deacetylase
VGRLLRRAARALFLRLLPAGTRNSLRLWLALEAPDAPPRPLDAVEGGRVLVLAPHMDDETGGCGGAIRKHVLAGAEVTIVYLTDGRRGDPELRRRRLPAAEQARAEAEYVTRRKGEAERAARVLGVRDLRYLDGPDGALEPTPALVEALRAILRERRPAVVYLPSFMDVHPDHWATNRVLHAALDPAAGATDGALVLRGYELWTPLLANRVLDISDVVAAKREALAQFESQLAHIDYVHALLGLNAYRSIYAQRGRGHAEAFLECTPGAWRDLFERITRRR